MMYLFQTTAALKPKDRGRLYINPEIVPDIYIEAETIKEALEKYREIARDENYVSVSDNAIRKRNPMCIELEDGSTKQVGYVMTGQIAFDVTPTKWTKMYIDLWVEIKTIIETDFEEAA